MSALTLAIAWVKNIYTYVLDIEEVVKNFILLQLARLVYGTWEIEYNICTYRYKHLGALWFDVLIRRECKNVTSIEWEHTICDQGNIL